MSNAIYEWLKEHKVGEGWEPIMGCMKKGMPIVILQNKREEYPYSVQYAGSGKYFKTLEEAKTNVIDRFGVLPIIAAPDLKKL